MAIERRSFSRPFVAVATALPFLVVWSFADTVDATDRGSVLCGATSRAVGTEPTTTRLCRPRCRRDPCGMSCDIT